MSEFSDIPEGVSTLRHYLVTLWRRRWLVLAPIVVLGIVTYVSSSGETALYQTSAEVLINRQEVAATSVVGQTPATDDVDRTMETNAQLALTPAVIERVIAARRLDMSQSTFRSRSAVYPVADLLRFVVNAKDPADAAASATEYARQFVAYRRALDTAGLSHTLHDLAARLGELERSGKTGSDLYIRLADQQQQLESLLALRTSNVSVVRRAQAADNEQISPRPRRDTAVALVGGLLLGLVLAFLAETLSTKARSADEIEARLGVPYLASLSGRLEPEVATDSALPDAFHRLRTRLELENRGVGAKSVLVTDVGGGAGLASVVAGLGIALARSGRRVALVDLDLRAGGLTRLFGLAKRDGVASVASAPAYDGALVSLPVDARAADLSAASPRLEILPSGPLPALPLEVLASPAIPVALAGLVERFDLVLVAVPDLLGTADAATLSEAADGVLVVVGASEARRPALAEARRLLEQWPAAKLGFVLDERSTRSGIHWRRRAAIGKTVVPVTTPEQAR